MPERQRCEVCGAEKPADMVDRTTVATVGALELDVCETCQLVQNHELPEDVCMKCGDDVDGGFYMEVEYPIGPSGALGQRSGTLCGDCAGWIGCRIAYQSLDADDDAREAHVELLDEEHERHIESETA